MTNKKYTVLAPAVILIACLIITLYYNKTNNTRTPSPKSVQWEAPDGRYYSLVDKQGDILLQTGLKVYPGDEYISHNNQHYRVTRVDGWKCTAQEVKNDPASKSFSLNDWLSARTASAENTPRVAIYHTHSDESYTPTQGVPSQPAHGAIFQVGDALTDSLSKSGITVYHDYTPHDPHDTHAYMRSRRTAFRLLKLNPTALFDI
ncbi:MAG: stage II sporulation protein P, partial [Candidatus Saccharibacteria bacterium]